jgi:hypothetical protein
LFESVNQRNQSKPTNVRIVFGREDVRISADIDETSAAVESSSKPLSYAVGTVFSGRQWCSKVAITRRV